MPPDNNFAIQGSRYQLVSEASPVGHWVLPRHAEIVSKYVAFGILSTYVVYIIVATYFNMVGKRVKKR